jgi:hypothetical protein
LLEIKNIVKVTHFLFPASLYEKSAKTSRKPVLTRDLLIMNIAPIVITALLLKPLIASSIVIILNTRSSPNVPRAVTSIDTISKTNEIIIIDMIIKN